MLGSGMPCQNFSSGECVSFYDGMYAQTGRMGGSRDKPLALWLPGTQAYGKWPHKSPLLAGLCTQTAALGRRGAFAPPPQQSKARTNLQLLPFQLAGSPVPVHHHGNSRLAEKACIARAMVASHATHFQLLSTATVPSDSSARGCIGCMK